MEKYLNNMFLKVDPNIKLDKNQKEVVLDNSDHLMVVAGAGSGKTMTIIAKVRYLVDKCGLNPEEILIISFTNKAVIEIQERLEKYFNISSPVVTFHKLGLDILRSASDDVKIVSSRSSIIVDYFIYNTRSDKSGLNNLIKMLTMYYSNSQINLKSIDEKKTEKIVIYEELLIANFLYINNVDYNYVIEGKYRYFKIYRNGVNYLLFYIRESKTHVFKIYNGHKINNIKNKYRDYWISIVVSDEKELINNLYIKLTEMGFNLDNNIDFSLSLISKNISKKFIMLCLEFIKLFKTMGYEEDYFNTLKNSYSKDYYISNFIEMIQLIYNYYQEYLFKNQLIDFEDMINKAATKIKEFDLKFSYKYIIIDEFQDISLNRLNLIKRINDISKGKLMVVGDDFQSIYGFAGSDILSFLSFEEGVDQLRRISITKTYRNSQELINIAGNFVMKNKQQIKKRLTSIKNLKNPLRIIKYRNDQAKKAHEIIVKIIAKFGLKTSILILGRYSFDIKRILDDRYFFEEGGRLKSAIYPELNLEFLTVHKSKGLGYDNVIVINNEDTMLGFPSKIKDVELISVLKTDEKSIPFAEERRLFYVALTRTKNYVYLMVKQGKESLFIKELEEYQIKYKN